MKFNVKVQDPTNNNAVSSCEVVDKNLEAATIQANMLFGTDNVLKIESKYEAVKSFLNNSTNLHTVRNIAVELLDGNSYSDVYDSYLNK